MQLGLRRSTQEQIQDIFKSVSYHRSLKRVSVPIQGDYPLIDSLLTAYLKNNENKCDGLVKTCENYAKKASNNCTVDIDTGAGGGKSKRWKWLWDPTHPEFWSGSPMEKVKSLTIDVIIPSNLEVLQKDAAVMIIPQRRNGTITSMYPHMIQCMTAEKILKYWGKISAKRCFESYRYNHWLWAFEDNIK